MVDHNSFSFITTLGDLRHMGKLKFRQKCITLKAEGKSGDSEPLVITLPNKKISELIRGDVVNLDYKIMIFNTGSNLKQRIQPAWERPGWVLSTFKDWGILTTPDKFDIKREELEGVTMEENKKPPSGSVKFFSMFTGIGGFEISLRNIFKDSEHTATSVGHSEIDRYASGIYKYNFQGDENYGDATGIDTDELPDFDFLCGGFPCQSFSVSGRRLGFDDVRGTLFFEIARVLRDKKPKHFLLENVKGLLSNKGGNTLTTIFKVLTDLGYVLQWQVCNSKWFVPQNRERIFIYGHLAGHSGRGSGQQIFPIYEGDGTSEIPIKRIAHNDVFRRYNQTYDTSGAVESLDTSGGGGHQPCVPDYDFKIRRLSPVECARLQGFPDDWCDYGLIDGKKEKISDTQKYKVFGNAVSPPMAEYILRRIFCKD